MMPVKMIQFKGARDSARPPLTIQFKLKRANKSYNRIRLKSINFTKLYYTKLLPIIRVSTIKSGNCSNYP